MGKQAVLMAILALSKDLADMRQRLGRLVLAYNIDGQPVTAEDLQVAGAMAVTMCEAKAAYPLVPPRPIDAKRAQKINWNDPALRAKLVGAYAVAGEDDEKAARILGVSLGSARLAKKRHLQGRSQNASFQTARAPPASDLP